MSQFQNLIRNPEPETTLFPQEIDALLAVIQSTLDTIAPQATRGTFVLDGQRYGADAKCILRFNLPDGSYHRNLFRIYSRSSDALAADAIDELLALPGKSRYHSDNPELKRHVTSEMAATTDHVPSGIYQDAELKVLVLNATHGRFLISCYLEGHDDAAEAMLYAVAYALTWLCQEDKEFQRFTGSIATAEHDDHEAWKLCATAIDATDQLFRRCTVPGLRAWRDWLEAAKAASKLTLFFE